MRVIVTAGPTREYLDPVRFLSNPSTGRMGFAVAAAARRRGHKVTLIAGPTVLKAPAGVGLRAVVSAREMLAAVERELAAALAGKETVVFVSTAAVADWRPARTAMRKLKKAEMSGVLKLVRNPDILRTVRRRFASAIGCRRLLLVGFAAETNAVLEEASRKCREKGLRFIVANDVSRADSGFGTPTNRVTFVFPDGRLRPFPLLSKPAVAARIVRQIESEALP